ncbi:MAG: hypothetical protein ACTSO7_13875 [Candidatus Heimdallarchaeota archaeon]
MKSKKLVLTTFVIVIFTLLTLTNLVSLNSMNTNGYKGEIPIVIFDIAHQQMFNDTHLQSALQMIEDVFGADVYINTDNFTLTNIRGADLIILPSPYFGVDDVPDGTGAFAEIERRALQEYYQDGGSVLFLANPYFYEEEQRNYSSDIVSINTMMEGSSGETGEDSYESLGFAEPYLTLFDDFHNEYNDPRFLYINESTFLGDHPIIEGYPADDSVEEILTYTTETNYLSASTSIINTSQVAYGLRTSGEMPSVGSVKTHKILAVEEKFLGRGVSVGSTIMFSDLTITNETTTTWYETYDNAQLWKNIIAWLLLQTPIVTPTTDIFGFGVFAGIIFGVFFIFFIVGIVLYIVGKDIKRAEVSETIIKMRERDEKREKVDEEIEEAYYAEDDVEVESVEEEEEVKEIDMKTISDEVKKKPPKTRSRSERRRRK